MKLKIGAAVRRIVRCLPDSGRSHPGSCRKTTGFSAICRGRPCRWAIRCEARCRRRYRVQPSAIGAAAAARLVPILRRRLERRSRCLKSKRESRGPRAFFGPVFIAIRQPLARVLPQFRSSIVPGEHHASAHTGRAFTPKERGEGEPVTRFSGSKFLAALQPRSVTKYALQLAIIGIGYFALAKATSALASLYSSTMPVWPSSGLALAGILVCGLR